MCVILVCPPKVRPDMATLQACWDANPHGAGMAWRERGEVRWLKTNDVKEIYDIAKLKHGEIVIHFRIASVGGVSDDLRHPFPVSKRSGLASSGSAKAVLFQNGTWGGYSEALRFAESEGHKIPEGKMSDSRAAAFLCSIYGHDFLKRCGFSRWVFFGAKGTAIYGDFAKVKGIRYSNTYWRRHTVGSALVVPKACDGPVCDDDEEEQERPHGPLRRELEEIIEREEAAMKQPNIAKMNAAELAEYMKKNQIPGVSGKVPDSQYELWNMSTTANYWDIVKRAKARRKGLL